MKNATKWFLLGIATIICGIFVLGNAAFASAAVVTVTGGFLLLGGIMQVVAGFGADSPGNKLLIIALGALTLMLGWSFLAHPLAGVISLTALILILLAAGGIVQIIIAFQFKGTSLFWIVLLSGVLSLALALFVMSSPQATMSLLGIILGVQLISGGASLVCMGLFEREAGVG